MDTQQITVRAVAELSRTEGLAPEKEYFLTYYREELLKALQERGFTHIELAEKPEDEAQPNITATRDGRQACLCLPPVPGSPMDLQALSAAQCAYCEQRLPGHDVYYAALLTNPQEGQLYLLDPVLIRTEERWLTQELELAQFLPFSRRPGIDRYSPIFGGAAMFKLSRMLIPHVLTHGELPRFSVQGLFADAEQGESGFYAIMGSAPPSFLMLVEREEGAEQPVFRRPFFFYGERPNAELELTRRVPDAPELVELLDKTGRVLCAECLETLLYPDRLPAGKHYRWTLSLVADRCRPLKREFSLSSGPLHEQIRRDYARARGEEPPQDFAVRVSTESMRNFIQDPRQSYAEICGRVTHVEQPEVDSHRALLVSLLPLQENDDVEVQVFISSTLGTMSEPPQVGDVLECAGFLYASPDAVVEDAESWQDSGEVAARQEEREQNVNALSAYERFSGYSLALGVVAAAFARAGYTLQAPPHCHTREEASLTAQNAAGQKLLLFVDTLTGGEYEPQFHFSEEQRSSILIRERSAGEGGLSAVHCLVSLKRETDCESYAVQLLTDPACPELDTDHLISEATQCPLPGAMSEERACRIICNAIASQAWGEFARAAAEDMTYTSLVNGTRTVGKLEYIRYMAERKQLWEEQMGWPGMRMETGTIDYQGARRPCFMIHCYGRAVGAAVVSLRGGFIADMETVPLEVNSTYTPDTDSAAPGSLYHPLRGQIIPFTTRQSPLQRFASAYLQECMIHKTGFISPAEDVSEPQPADTSGVQFTLRKKGARWIKFVRNGPTFCDFAFSCSGRIYAVCAVETDQHPDRGGDIRSIVSRLPEIQQLLDLSERYGLIPCVFPAMRGHTPNPKTTWNLWDARSLAPLHPEQMPDAAPAPPSDWELLNAATSELVAVTERSGGSPLGCHDLPDLRPHFWFYDALGRLSWVITRLQAQATAPTEAELQIARLLPGTRGYVMNIEAWGNAEHTAPAHAGSPLYLRLSEPQLLEP